MERIPDETLAKAAVVPIDRHQERPILQRTQILADIALSLRRLVDVLEARSETVEGRG